MGGAGVGDEDPVWGGGGGMRWPRGLARVTVYWRTCLESESSVCTSFVYVSTSVFLHVYMCGHLCMSRNVK